MVYYALSARLPRARGCLAPPSHESDSAVRPPLRGQRYSVMPVNDPTIDIARIDRDARRGKLSRAEPSRARPGQAVPEPRRAVPN